MHCYFLNVSCLYSWSWNVLWLKLLTFSSVNNTSDIVCGSYIFIVLSFSLTWTTTGRRILEGRGAISVLDVFLAWPFKRLSVSVRAIISRHCYFKWARKGTDSPKHISLKKEIKSHILFSLDVTWLQLALKGCKHVAIYLKYRNNSLNWAVTATECVA